MTRVHDLGAMSREQLIDLKWNEEHELDDIKTQIGAAKANAVKGQYSDPDWWARVNESLRNKQRFIQKIQWTLRETRSNGMEERIDRLEQMVCRLCEAMNIGSSK